MKRQRKQLLYRFIGTLSYLISLIESYLCGGENGMVTRGSHSV